MKYLCLLAVLVGCSVAPKVDEGYPVLFDLQPCSVSSECEQPEVCALSNCRARCDVSEPETCGKGTSCQVYEPATGESACLP